MTKKSAKKSVKLDKGTVYQKTENGNYYFRYQINGQRKAVGLNTKNQKDAIEKAEAMIPLIKASSSEIVAAHVQYAKGWTLTHIQQTVAYSSGKRSALKTESTFFL